jgi:hypothetical protein
MRFAFALLVAARVAYADPLSATAQTSSGFTTAHPIALAVNEPFAWLDGSAFGASAYAALDAHQVIHLNVANWAHSGRSIDIQQLEDGFFTSDERSGRKTDIGAAWMYFPRRAYDGFSFEAGALVRIDRSIDSPGEGDDYTDLMHHTTTIGARSLVGWSWLGWNRIFVSLQAGFSIGQEFGHEQDIRYLAGYAPMSTTSEIDKTTISGEAFMRFGVLLNP